MQVEMFYLWAIKVIKWLLFRIMWLIYTNEMVWFLTELLEADNYCIYNGITSHIAFQVHSCFCCKYFISLGLIELVASVCIICPFSRGFENYLKTLCKMLWKLWRSAWRVGEVCFWSPHFMFLLLVMSTTITNCQFPLQI